MHVSASLKFLTIAAIAKATKLDVRTSDIGEITSHLYMGQHPPIKVYQSLRFGINPSRLFALIYRFLTIAAIVKAYKLDDDPLDVIVEAGLEKGGQENTGCVDTMARNGG